MNTFFNSHSVRMTFLMLATSFLFTACGGGGGTADTAVTPPVATASTGTVVILLTDAPVDELSEINLDVTEVILIGDMGQQTVFEGNQRINLLDLANFSQPIIFGEVEAGSYTKIRLRIENIELVEKGTGMTMYPKLPANGKIDLLDQGGFAVVPGRTLLAEIDIDANKSIHIVGTGSNKYLFRPVVNVNIMDGGLPAKLVRLEGVVAEIFDEPAGSFLLCHAEEADSCVIVNVSEDTCLFDTEGRPTTVDALAVDDPVVVIGAFRHEDDGDGDTGNGSDGDGDSDAGRVDMDLEIDAIVIEIGGNEQQINGVVVNPPNENGKFELAVGDGQTMTVQLQDGTKIFGADGPLGPEALLTGTTILVEGVVEMSENPDVNDLIWAALIFVDVEHDEESLSGEILDEPDPATRTFRVSADSGDVCVEVAEEAKIILVSQDSDGTVSKEGMFSDLELGQSVVVFGQSGVGGCFQANEVVVDLTGQP
jgi:hypothetical protein